jgi:hypothetical protein
MQYRADTATNAHAFAYALTLAARQNCNSSNNQISMKFFYLLFTSIIFLVFLSCRSSQKAFGKNHGRKDFNHYLLEIANDTNVFELPALKIVDDGILPILDSVITSAENCKYFDKRIKYEHAFMIDARVLDNGIVRYSISAHQSIQDVIGLTANKLVRGLNSPTNVGVFYYKKYLFSTSLSNYQQNFLTKYPFLSNTGCTYRIKATKLFSVHNYSSYINFTNNNRQFKITENEICGSIILIE